MLSFTTVAVTCCRIISEDGLIGRVCDVCAGVGPIHIQSEGSRLLATLVKYCESPGNTISVCMYIIIMIII